MGDGVNDAEVVDEARGSQRIGPVGHKRAKRHDDEGPPCPAVVGGCLDPQNKQRRASHEKERCGVLDGGQLGEARVRGQPSVDAGFHKEAGAGLEAGDVVGVRERGVLRDGCEVGQE